MIRRLGGRRWNLLHRLVYVTGVLRGHPLLVAGEGGHQPSAGVRDRGRAAAGIPDLLVLVAHQAGARTGSRDRVRLGVGVMARAPSSGGKTRLAPHLSATPSAGASSCAAR